MRSNVGIRKTTRQYHVVGWRQCSFMSVMKCDADICKNLQVNVEFPGGITIDFLTMPRTISMPQIGGLVQRREVTSVGLESRLDNDRLIVCSVSPRPTYFERCSFDDRLLDEAPSTDHCTRGTLVRGGVSLQPVDTCSPQDLQQEWTVRLPFQVGAISAWIAAKASVDSMVLVYKVLKNPVWCGLHVEFLVGLKRTWDQKLSSGLLLTFMTTHLFQFRFADTEQYWLITLTFFRTGGNTSLRASCLSDGSWILINCRLITFGSLSSASNGVASPTSAFIDGIEISTSY